MRYRFDPDKVDKTNFYRHFNKNGSPKNGWTTEEEAERHRPKIMENKKDYHVYKCVICGLYHIGGSRHKSKGMYY